MDREDDHGEESEGKEEIDEKESRSGAQEEENRKIRRTETGEAFGEKGRSEAQGSGQETGSGRAGG